MTYRTANVRMRDGVHMVTKEGVYFGEKLNQQLLLMLTKLGISLVYFINNKVGKNMSFNSLEGAHLNCTNSPPLRKVHFCTSL